MRRIYLDHAATTPIDPRVFEAMLPFLKEHFGNASSVHALGRKARFAVEESRERIAAALGAEPGEIVFTSGGTESDNAALHGLCREGRRGVVTSTVEHEAVLRTAERLAAQGEPVRFLEPEPTGAVPPERVSEAITEETRLVSIMHANNELGTLTDVPAMASECRARGVLFHTDAVQTAGLFRLSVDDLGVDALSLSAHKFYGPKGVGALYVRGGTDFRAFVESGAQERRRRAGTENVAAIVGMAEALALAHAEAEHRLSHLTDLRKRLVRNLMEAFGDRIILNTPLGRFASAPHIVNLAFPPREGRPFDGEMLLLNLDMEGICASSGSACTSGAVAPSHVLLALGQAPETASAALRLSMGKDNTFEEIDRVVEALVRIVRRMEGQG